MRQRVNRENLRRALLMALDMRTSPMPLNPAVARDQERDLGVLRWALEKVDVLTLEMVNEQSPSDALQIVRHALLVHIENAIPIERDWFELAWRAYRSKHPETK